MMVTMTLPRPWFSGWESSGWSTQSRPYWPAVQGKANKRTSPEEQVWAGVLVTIVEHLVHDVFELHHGDADKLVVATEAVVLDADVQLVRGHLLLVADDAEQQEKVEKSGGEEKQGGCGLTSGRSRWTLATNCRPFVLFGTSSSYPQGAVLIGNNMKKEQTEMVPTYQVDLHVRLEGLGLLNLQVVRSNNWKRISNPNPHHHCHHHHQEKGLDQVVVKLSEGNPVTILTQCWVFVTDSDHWISNGNYFWFLWVDVFYELKLWVWVSQLPSSLSSPFKVTLCSPVPGCVYKSTW